MLLTGTPAYSAGFSPALTFSGRYEFTYLGIGFGEMAINIQQTAHDYKVISDVASTGIVKIFVNHTDHTEVKGTANGKDFTYPAVAYHSHYTSNGKEHDVAMTYTNGQLVDIRRDPPLEQGRPDVPEELKKTALDPLSFILRMREKIAAAMASGQDQFTLDAYDGRRLTRAFFAVHGPAQLDYQGQPARAIEVTVTRKLIAGLTDAEKDEYDRKDPPLHAYFSDDGRLVLLRAEAQTWIGTVAATLAE